MTKGRSREQVVDNFEASLASFTERLGAQLRPHGRIELDLPAWRYVVQHEGCTASLLVHEIEVSGDDPPAYQARLVVPVMGEIGQFLRGGGAWSNRYACLGAATDAADGVEIVSQAILTDPDIELISGLMALAAVHGANSLVQSIRNATTKASPAVISLSQWSDLDFERIHYLNAQIGAADLLRRSWRVLVGEPGPTSIGTIEMVAVDDNPFWRGGLLVLARVRKDYLGLQGPAPIEDINRSDWLYARTPMFGGWCDEEQFLTFVTFVPNLAKALSKIDNHLISWARSRAHRVKRLLKVSEQSSLTADAVGNN